jgi:hypothetical protein
VDEGAAAYLNTSISTCLAILWRSPVPQPGQPLQALPLHKNTQSRAYESYTVGWHTIHLHGSTHHTAGMLDNITHCQK